MLYSKRTYLLALGLALFWSARTNAEIRGNIDGVYYVNGLTVASGWACDAGRSESIAVHLYAGGPAGTGNYVNATTANLPNEPAVNAVCGASGNHRFQIEIGNYQAQNIAKTIYVHGISITGGANLTIGNSGSFIFPDSIFGYIFESPFQMRVSKKYAGAIDSFYWRDQHFVDVADHGREWQVAGQFKGFGECYNPTEGGNLADEDNPTSSSVFTYLSTYDNVLFTRNTPAFWLRPRSYGGSNPDYYSSPNCTDYWGGPVYRRDAANTTILSNYEFRKMAVFGFQGIPNAIWFNVQVVMPETVTNGIQVEAPALWMLPIFSNFWQFNLPTSNSAHGTYSVLDPATSSKHQPIVFEKPDPQYPGDSSKGLAIGTYAPDVVNSPPGTDNINNYWWPVNNEFSFLSFQFRKLPPGGAMQGQILSYNTYVVLGTRDEVKAALESLHCYFTGICP
jgi:hypothetical protein